MGNEDKIQVVKCNAGGLTMRWLNKAGSTVRYNYFSTEKMSLNAHKRTISTNFNCSVNQFK